MTEKTECMKIEDVFISEEEYDEVYSKHLVDMDKAFKGFVLENKDNEISFIILHQLIMYLNDLITELEYFSIKEHGVENIDITVRRLLKYSKEAIKEYDENVFPVLYEKMNGDVE